MKKLILSSAAVILTSGTVLFFVFTASAKDNSNRSKNNANQKTGDVKNENPFPEAHQFYMFPKDSQRPAEEGC